MVEKPGDRFANCNFASEVRISEQRPDIAFPVNRVHKPLDGQHLLSFVHVAGTRPVNGEENRRGSRFPDRREHFGGRVGAIKSQHQNWRAGTIGIHLA